MSSELNSTLLEEVRGYADTHLSLGTFLGFFAGLVLLDELLSWWRRTSCPSVGWGNWPILRWLSTVRAMWNSTAYLEEANRKYLSRNIPCRLPDSAYRNLVVLPRSCMQWMIEQPDSLMHRSTTAYDMFLAGPFLWCSKAPFVLPLHDGPSRKWLARRVEENQDDVMQSISEEMQACLGDDTESWKRVNLAHLMESTAHRLAWTLVVGEALSHRSDLKGWGEKMFMFTFGFGLIVKSMPSFLRDPVLWLCKQSTQNLLTKITNVTWPVMREGMDKLNKGAELDSFDYLTWAVKRAKFDYGVDYIDEVMARKIVSECIIILIGSTHTVSITMIWTLITLLSSPKADVWVPKMRNEVLQVMAEASGNTLWNRKTLGGLVRIDSTIRESMRIHPFSIVQPLGKVLDDVEIDIPGGPEVKIKKGTTVTVPVFFTHRDEELYPNADEFDAFRFEKSKTPASTSSSTHTPWSVGRWACPGRYHAVNAMKMMMAELLLKYDVKLTDETFKKWAGKPPMRLGLGLIPETFATVHVRRRKD